MKHRQSGGPHQEQATSFPRLHLPILYLPLDLGNVKTRLQIIFSPHDSWLPSRDCNGEGAIGETIADLESLIYEMCTPRQGLTDLRPHFDT